MSFALCVLHSTARAQAPSITAVVVEQEGRVVTDQTVLSLIETPVGQPLSVRGVRETIDHLTSLNRFDDVQVFQESAGGGLRVRYVLYPLHPIDRIEFRGSPGLSEGDLRRVVRERFGAASANARADEVPDVLKQAYRLRGYPQAQVTTRIEETHDPDRATLIVEVNAGPRAIIRTLNIEQAEALPAGVFVSAPDIRIGQPYDADRIQREIEQYAESMRDRGYLEANASHIVAFEPDGAVVTVFVERGPRVTIAFAGDELPRGERDRLVPVRAEQSVDEDLLEDAQNGIQDYFRLRGYRNVTAPFERMESPGELTITFTVNRGPLFVIDEVSIMGNAAMTTAEIEEAMRLKRGEPLVQQFIDGGAAVIRNSYRNRGFAKAQVTASVSVLPSEDAASDTRRVSVAVSVVEGPRTTVRNVTIAGSMAVPEADLRRLVSLESGKPFSEVEVAANVDRLDLEYRNRGYENVRIDGNVALAENDTRADVTFRISEGQQVLVDHVIVVGNERTSPKTILQEVTLVPEQPLGYSALIESQQRLQALGLFRSVRITEVRHSGDSKRDVLVRVEEAPPTTIAWGGGGEVGSTVRATGAGGAAEEHYEFVPRASFEIGRRNLWGKNRSVNLFARAALRNRDIVQTDEGVALSEVQTEKGFNEYRLLGAFREPRVFRTRADFTLTGVLDQARRTGFNFLTRESRAELGMRLSPQFSVTGRYSFQHTELFDETFDQSQKPLIDRAFPQVRLSRFSGTLIQDSRDDRVDPNRGLFAILDGELAARAIGSEVGFAKAYLQLFGYQPLPSARRMVLAGSVRVGLAHGFTRVTAEGQEAEDQLPASERFFAGGAGTVRGFALDRLGERDKTITQAGFPTGGNGVVILNGELRVQAFGPVGLVGFVDAGNVFEKASELSFTNLRPAVGFGVAMRLPFVSLVRVDVGFNPDRREITQGTLERGVLFHFTLGQPF